MCGKSKRCEKKGGMCFRKKNAPDNAEPLGKKGCKGKCSCYKIPETTTPETTRSNIVCTVDGPDQGKRCQFPFKFKGETFNECIKKGRGRSRPWCPTKLKKNGKQDGRNSWGYCGRCSEGLNTLRPLINS